MKVDVSLVVSFTILNHEHSVRITTDAGRVTVWDLNAIARALDEQPKGRT